MKSRKAQRGDYSIGYAKPPVEHQFKRGNTEHLKRSKRATKIDRKLFRDLVAASTKASRNGAVVYRSRLELLVETFMAAAVRGDVRAAATLLKMHRRSKQINEFAPLIIELSGDDARL